ncbi:MAG: hypothetical protein J5905_00410 [Prevotella sp.]|nr:hypothetical protein [Prevotella sp.]
MKRFIIIIALYMSVYNASGSDVTVEDVIIPQGGQTTISINMKNSDRTYTAGQMMLKLPMGVTALLDKNGNPITTKGERMVSTNHTIGATHLEDGTDQFTIFSISSDAIMGTEGNLFSITVVSDASLEIGTKLEGVLSNIEMTTMEATPMTFDNQIFTITIGEKADTRIVLDENATTVPENAKGINVRVKYVSKANEWNTICLPFTMTEAQVKKAFGDNVILADFTNWNSEEDSDGNIVAINVFFSEVSSIEANHPYIIKMSTDIEEFTVDYIDISAEEEPTVQIGKKKAERGYFIGTYMAGTEIPEDDLFLNNSKFRYSSGQIKSKAFHAYLELADTLKNTAESDNMISITLEENTTGIYRRGIVPASDNTVIGVYTIEGKQISQPQKGLNILKNSDGTTRKLVK